MEKSPYIGTMDRIVKIYTVTNVKNNIGEVKPERVLLCAPWAAFEDLKTNTSDSEYVEGKVMHLMDAAFTIRWRERVKKEGTKMVMEFEGKKFRVEHVLEIGRRKHLKLFVKNHE